MSSDSDDADLELDDDEDEMLTAARIGKMKVKELKRELQGRGLDDKGRKAVLAAYARHAEGAPAAAALSVKERRKTFKVKLKKIDAVAVEKKLARLK